MLSLEAGKGFDRNNSLIAASNIGSIPRESLRITDTQYSNSCLQQSFRFFLAEFSFSFDLNFHTLFKSMLFQILITADFVELSFLSVFGGLGTRID